MRKIMNLFLISLSVLLILTTSVIVRAAQNTNEAINDANKEGVDYVLAYPGILPDHPLYFLKMIRDKVVGFLITDLVKKTEFNLLMADKRLFAGMLLADEGKEKLAEETVSKAEKYFILAVDCLKRAKEQELNVKETGEKLRKAAVKHKEELENLKKRTGKEVERGIDESLGIVKEQKERIDEVLKED